MCNFSIAYPKSKDELISQFKSTVNGQSNGQFEGDETMGTFSFTALSFDIAGGYVINGDIIEVNISKKPFVLSCGKIESEIRKFLGV